MAAAAAAALGIPADRVHLRRRRTRPAAGPRYGRLDDAGQRIVVREGDLRFWVNLTDYLDTGLFPDHRETRARVRAEARGADFLNLFGYTGSFTCCAAAGGARATTTVDLSATYLGWTRDNLELNGLWGPGHALARAEASDLLRRARREGRRWDLCVLDPPSFSTRGGGAGGDLDVQRDHRALIEQALAVLRPGGVLYFSTNHQRFEPAIAGLPAAEAREITAETVPEDFRNRAAHRAFRIVA
jgi:23S rRNA G2069 N7-methylase RlmK/C1962 C5-methylase RlmI